MKKIQVTVDEEGNIYIDMDGFQGETCAAELKRVLENLAEMGVNAGQVSEKRKGSGMSAGVRQKVSN